MSTDEILDAIKGISWSDVESAVSDALSDIDLGDIVKVADAVLAQTETQRRRRGRGKKRGWGKHIANAAKDFAGDVADGMVKDASNKIASGAFSWLAQAEDVDAIVDQVGALSLDEVAKAGEDLWNELGQSEADGVFGDIGHATDDLWGHVEKLFAQAEAEDVDAIVDQVGALSLDEVAKAGEDLWNELG